jgi:hypothetical protein
MARVHGSSFRRTSSCGITSCKRRAGHPPPAAAYNIYPGRDGEDRSITTDVAPPIWEAPPPILFNAHKHHAAFLGERIRQAIAAGPVGLPPLAAELCVVGTRLMDLYHGPFSPREIGAKVLARLECSGRQAPDVFRAWVEAGGGYRMIDFPEDGSRWVVRRGKESGRFVHVHPARRGPSTVRVRANVLTTAVLALAHVGIHGGDPLDRQVVNAVRRDYLRLAPVGRDPSVGAGIGSLIEVLAR